ncbi:MAG: GNAT family N-acetyltransferase [Pseudomonadota bacterium]
MTESNQVLSAADPGREIEESWFRLRRVFSLLPGAQVRREGPLRCIVVGPGPPGGNCVFGSGEPGELTPETLDRVLGLYSRPGWSVDWRFGPVRRPEDLDRILRERGFVRHNEMTGMALDLTGADWGDFEPVPDQGQRIERVFDQAGLKDLIGLFGRSIGAGPGWAELTQQAHGLVDFGPGGEHAHFAARRGGELIGCASLEISGPVGGLFFIGVAEGFRGRGLGRALTRTVLDLAKARGCRLAVLQASDLGRRVYRRLGFGEYGRLFCYRREF